MRRRVQGRFQERVRECADPRRTFALGPGAVRFRWILLTPGLFPRGWLPPAVSRGGDGYFWLEADGLRARLASAVVQRADVVSGWDLARTGPKPAERVVPSGSVYWFDRVEGDLGVLARVEAEGLWALMSQELHGEEGIYWESRRAEGFGTVLTGAWTD